MQGQITSSHYITTTGITSSILLVLLAITTLTPLYISTTTIEALPGTPQESTITLGITNNTASVELSISSTNGTFATSDPAHGASFSVSTNNFSGYTLAISASNNTGLLSAQRGDAAFSSIASATSESAFSEDTSAAASTYNGKWGYKPNKLNSTTNTNYLPAPTTTPTTLDTTTTSNTTANNYTIALGVRADRSTPSATYSSSFSITAIPNPINYTIAYDKNTTTTVSNLPAAQSGTINTTNITPLHQRSIPSRLSFHGLVQHPYHYSRRRRHLHR